MSLVTTVPCIKFTPEAVIFDLDGTLIDSEPLWHIAEIKVFGELGLSLTKGDCEKTTGVRIDGVVEFWRAQRPWSGASNEEVVARIIDEVARLFAAQGKATPGAIPLIDALARAGLPLAVASASPHRLIEANLAALGIVSRFKVIHSAEFELRGKPDPAVFLTTANKLGVSPASCLVVEDSLKGIAAAKAAGMFCVAVQEKSTSFEEAKKLADFGVSRLDELCALLPLNGM